ncbi:3-methyladenine DNA glycosylase [Gordonia rubripertincta]|uniref:3-methyladenine DNA glycosylase n=1 Tax=Gordonia rubripertincta TaxID=36822 RepID=A0ABT4MXY8_GORRU|nr:3-methyladenine DNA glycosylase [Gordonia rubripertincta]MCZ4550901.1 3-methyladenine DNA glycosylase [Gordonia rubripertincta]
MTAAATAPPLPEAVWLAAAHAHRDRVDGLLRLHPPTVRDSDLTHPVWGFLFTYYNFRPAQLRRWHPGHGVALAGPAARRYAEYTGYTMVGDVVTVSADYLRKRRRTVDFVVDLLATSRDRSPRFNCFGLHEWAMVFGAAPEQIRHSGVPLRLSPADTDEVVRSLPLRCTHFDAYRFFTEPARPLNLTVLDRDTQVRDEQPGCIHAGMDLYKWAHKLSPLLPAELVVDAFDLALDFRELDMRASPYDLSEFELDPIRIEDAAGRAEYVRAQTILSGRSQHLRSRLIETCRRLSARGLAAGTEHT